MRNFVISVLFGSDNNKTITELIPDWLSMIATIPIPTENESVMVWKKGAVWFGYHGFGIYCHPSLFKTSFHLYTVRPPLSSPF